MVAAEAASELQAARLVAPKAEEGLMTTQVLVAAAMAEKATARGSQVVAVWVVAEQGLAP